MTEATGTFWCETCQSDYPDTLRDSHMASHGEDQADWVVLETAGPFWVNCVLIGAVAALAVNTLL